MCDQGNILIFNSKECEIREEVSDRLVVTATSTPNSIYILSEIGMESCCLEKKMNVGFGIKEWDIYTLTTLSILTRSKL